MDSITTYLRDLRDIRSSGSAVKETSYYPALTTLLNAIGHDLRPRVHCILTLKNSGSGIPDGGLFTADQIGAQAPSDAFPAPQPARGVLEVKGTSDDVVAIAQSPQVQKYLTHYGQVLVTNYRDFLLVGRDAHGHPLPQERYTLAATEAEFWTHIGLATFTDTHRERLTEYLRRVLLAAAPLTNPADVAWFLASYARDARARIDHSHLPALLQLRTDLEQALGISFDERRGDHFFRSTLIQTLFYGVFSAWVLWHHEQPERTDRFDWRLTQHYLRVPVLQALFGQISSPLRLKPLGLIEVLDWTGAALNRVERGAFFARFDTGQAVQYFYEPFLEAFDPELRKELGVWYTPPEVVRYMVARVDAALRTELGVADGLADPSVYVLDPCTGTGAYVAEVLRQIATTLQANGADAMLGQDVKRAALTRVFGFELLPAPFVVAHLQIGLLLQQLGAPLDEGERVGVYLTNALTGWAPPDAAKAAVQHAFTGLLELAEERDQAQKVKQATPILVILGNPPYAGMAGIAQIEEERDLTNAYRTTKHAPAPQGQGLNDLYVRFFRMAERQIVQGSGRGIVCYISNYSWLDGLSHTGMRERYLEVFDQIWIDSLNGDKYRTGKQTPEGESDPSVFSTEFNPEGIQVGTAIALMVRRAVDPHPQPLSLTGRGESESPAPPSPVQGEGGRGGEGVHFRTFWGRTKRAQLQDALDDPATHPYQPLNPPVEIGLPFQPAQVNAEYLTWPLLPDLLPTVFSGVKTSRDDVLVSIDRERLIERMQHYFDPQISHAEMTRIAPGAMENVAGFDATATRDALRKRGFLPQNVVRYCYRPFDVRWLYWEPETKLLDGKRSDYFPHVFEGNIALVSQQKPRREWSLPQVIHSIGCLDLMDRGASCIPLFLRTSSQMKLNHTPDLCDLGDGRRLNLSDAAVAYLTHIGSMADAEALFSHSIAILHAPAYRVENAGALRQDWPRVPLPSRRDLLLASADLGQEIAALLNSELPVAGVTSGALREELKPIGILSVIGGGPINLAAGDLDVTAGWGFGGRGGITMPGKGKLSERAITASEENPALGLGAGASTYDIRLNERVCWRNIPPRVWDYTIGGYQVIKKWLSYRERVLLGRGLNPDEARAVTQIARRIAAILLREAELDQNYRDVAGETYTRVE